MPVASEFILHNIGEGGIAQQIGVDWTVYQDLDDLIASVFWINSIINGFDCSILSGKYATGTLSKKSIKAFSASRGLLGLMLSVLQEKLPEIHYQEQNLTRYDVYRGNSHAVCSVLK